MRKFRRDKQVGYLKLMYVEINYKLVYRLCFVDVDGSFLYSHTWRSNAHVKSKREIESLGYIEFS
jgi:hypothetical protein